MINEQKIRDLYLEHIGSIEAERAAGTAEAPFVVLQLSRLGRFQYAYATLGASEGPLGHELLLDTTEILPSLGIALETIARAAPTLAPGVVIPQVIADTPFTALLCLALEDRDGSFSLVKGTAPPYAYRLVPLTAAEQTLAEREPERAFELLLQAGALTVDPYRACLVDVPPPPPAARTEIALERRQARAAVLTLQAQLRREHGPRYPTAEPGDRREWRTDVRLHPGSHIALFEHIPWLIRWALGPFTRHPAPVTYLFGELIFVTFATHPDAVRMLDRVLDPRNLPRPAAVDLGREAAKASRRVLEALAIAIARCHPGEETAAALLAHGQPAIEGALSTFDPADEIPIENHVWATMLPVLYEGLEAMKQPAVRGMPKVFRRVAQSELLLEYEPDPRPPMNRLDDIAKRLATELVTAYAAGLRGQLPG